MSVSTRHVLGGIIRATLSRRTFKIIVRSILLTSRTSAKSSAPNEETNNEPMKFSTSKASHRSWKVDRSMGSRFQRPWWKVLPISLVGAGVLLWCAFREETAIDAQLEKDLYEQLPGLLSDEDTSKVQNK